MIKQFQLALHAVMLCALVFFCNPVAAEEDEHHEKPAQHSDEEAFVITPDALRSAGITKATAQARPINRSIRLNGQLALNENETVHIIPRFPGVLREVRKRQGDTVERGELVALVESNQNLQPYEIKSPIKGVVISRHASNGEYVSGEEDIFVVSDLTKLWAELFIFAPDFNKARTGQKVIIHAENREQPISAAIDFISSLVEEKTQSKFIRAFLHSIAGLYPGQFITAELIQDELKVSVAVEAAAVNRKNGGHVVFVPEGEAIKAVPVDLGQTDGHYSEIKTGLSAGQEYFTGNTSIIKAEMDKGKADHQH